MFKFNPRRTLTATASPIFDQLDQVLALLTTFAGRIPGPWAPEIKAGAAAAFLLAAMLGWLTGGVGRNAIRPVAEPEWQPPVVVPFNPRADLDQLANRPLWGKRAAPSGAGALGAGDGGAKDGNSVLVIPGYKVMGVIQRGGAGFVIIKPDNATNVTYHGVGESLPDGAILLEVRAADVTLDRNGQRETRRLFDVPKR
jgi:hypothetical protein